MTPEEKEHRKRDRMIAKFQEYTLGTAKNKVAADFQLMVRAKSAALPPGLSPAFKDGQIVLFYRRIGECVCVTCGTVGWWKGSSIGGGFIETGHFLSSRAASIIFEERNAHPQCKRCNRHLSGNQGAYTLWMSHVYGQEEIDRLERLKNKVRQFTREELVDLRIEFRARTKAAEERMAKGY